MAWEGARVQRMHRWARGGLRAGLSLALGVGLALGWGDRASAQFPTPGPTPTPFPTWTPNPGGDPDGDAGSFAHADAFALPHVHADVHARASYAAPSHGNPYSLADGFSHAHRYGSPSPPASAPGSIGGIRYGEPRRGHTRFGCRSVAADRRSALGAGGRGRPGLAGGFAGVAPPAIPGAAVGARAQPGDKRPIQKIGKCL